MTNMTVKRGMEYESLTLYVYGFSVMKHAYELFIMELILSYLKKIHSFLDTSK